MEKSNSVQIGPWKGPLRIFEATPRLLSAHPVFGQFSTAQVPLPSPDDILQASLAASGSHVTLASPIRSFHLRLCFGRENTGLDRIEVLLSKAMVQLNFLGHWGAPSGVQCPMVSAAPDCVFPDLGLFVL